MKNKKLAFLFPGQGSQYRGMGKNIYNKYKIVREIYDKTSDILDYDLKKISFDPQNSDINRTKYTQPAILTYNIAIFKILQKLNYSPNCVAGHSLGEFSALVSINCIDFKDALTIIKIRAEEMEKCGINRPGKMVALINFSYEKINEIFSNVKGTAVIANINSNKQTIISGDSITIDSIIEFCKKNKLRGVIPLNVSGAFHSPLMKKAKISLEKIIKKTKFNDVKIPIYQNYTAKSNTLGNVIKKNLINQITSPVLWLDTVNNIVNDSITNHVEVGPGNVLKNLNKNINKDIYNIDYTKLI
tara:strand:+ start:11021 stop:11923 length:903 start_codon:yes stop_codon:yes gene_type:complete